MNADLSIPIIFDEAPTLPQNAALDEYESVEGLSGSRFNDVLKGYQHVGGGTASCVAGRHRGLPGQLPRPQGIALINGLQAVLGLPTLSSMHRTGAIVYNAGDIILGGDGSDLIQGNAGDDIIDGDKWLNVRIGIMTSPDPILPTV